MKIAEELAYGSSGLGERAGPSLEDMEHEKSSLEIFRHVKANQPELWKDFSKNVRYLPKFQINLPIEHDKVPWLLPEPSWLDPPALEGSAEESPLLTLLKLFCANQDFPFSAEHLYSIMQQKNITLKDLQYAYSASMLKDVINVDADSCRKLLKALN